LKTYSEKSAEMTKRFKTEMGGEGKGTREMKEWTGQCPRRGPGTVDRRKSVGHKKSKNLPCGVVKVKEMETKRIIRTGKTEYHGNGDRKRGENITWGRKSNLGALWARVRREFSKKSREGHTEKNERDGRKGMVRWGGRDGGGRKTMYPLKT